ncbi:MAG: hypothetical protein LLF75_00780 [Eubacteriales bacterium]|nr:hypothetical protein [Eubacteriales bacterium]
MKKWKKVFLGLIILSVAALTTYIAIDLSSGPKFILPAKAIEYHTKEELTELYWQNEDLLSSVKSSVLSNEGMLQELIEFKEGDTGILTEHKKDFFTEDEWANIVSVFEKLHPYMIMMERKGRPLTFYIVSGYLKQDSVSKCTLLYWFPNEDERIYHEKPGVFPDGVFTQIDGGWYIVEETDDR